MLFYNRKFITSWSKEPNGVSALHILITEPQFFREDANNVTHIRGLTMSTACTVTRDTITSISIGKVKLSVLKPWKYIGVQRYSFTDSQ